MPSTARKNFFDSRDKYLSFVNSTDEKGKIAFYLSRALGKPLATRPFRILDAGVGEGTVIATFLTAVHKRLPNTPIVVTGKEISIDDVCILLSYLADRFYEHKTLVFNITNLTYKELTTLPAARFEFIRKELTGDTSYDFSEQLMNMSAFVKKNWALNDADDNGRLTPKKKVFLTIYRKDQKERLANARLIHKRDLANEFDLIIASQPFRLRQDIEKTVAHVLAPLFSMLRRGGEMVLIYSSGRDFSRPLLRYLYPNISPFANADPQKLLRAVRRHPQFSAAATRLASLRYGFINLYLGRKDFSLTNIFSLWNAVTYVGQISESEQRARPLTRAVTQELHDRLGRAQNMTFLNHVIHFTAAKEGASLPTSTTPPENTSPPAVYNRRHDRSADD